MEELLLINPAKRPSKRKGAKTMSTRRKTRSPAQKAATKRMLAANRARRAPAYKSNPAPRKRRTTARHVAHSVRRATRRYRRNPIGSDMSAMFMPAMQGAAGALTVNTLLNYLPLPLTLTTGTTRFLTQGVAAVLLGTFGGKIMPRQMAQRMAVGSLTVSMHSAAKELMAGTGLNLGAYNPVPSFNRSALPNSGSPRISNMGEYINRDRTLGEMVRQPAVSGVRF